jgi:hypothetical protein
MTPIMFFPVLPVTVLLLFNIYLPALYRYVVLNLFVMITGKRIFWPGCGRRGWSLYLATAGQEVSGP